MHTSNAAFERYYRIEADEVKAVYEKTRTGSATPDGGTKVESPSASSEPAKIL
jgi:hypothetical protein